jgi:bifunctional oligoribonuclease and PAP phosphatase NrnA
LGLALRRLGKAVTMACPTAPLPASLTFIPGAGDIVSAVNGPFDLTIVLDCSDTDRLEKLATPSLLAGRPLVNIDHHFTNTQYGSMNWVDSSAAAAAELVLALVKDLGVPLDQEIATALLTGITTDTLGFRTSSTTARTLRSAADLMDAGASLPDIVEQVYNAKPLGVARIWGDALHDLQAENGLVWTSVTADMLQRNQTEPDEVKGLVSFLRGTQGTHIAVLFVENGDNRIKVEFRGSRLANVADLAARLGGGGHKAASGCTLPGPLASAQQRVLSAARRALPAEER